MGKQLIMVKTITYAIKGRDLLRSMGFTAYIERTPRHYDRAGCGYSIFVSESCEAAIRILQQHGISVRGTIAI